MRRGTNEFGHGRGPLLALLLVVLATAVVFGPALVGDFVWDDWQLIVRNQLVRDPSHLPDVLTSAFWNVSSKSTVARQAYVNLYRPFVSLAYVTQFQLFGEEPLGYHVLSLLLHLGCVVMGYFWLARRLERRDHAWLAAAVGVLPFALHSSRPETVAWISGSTDLWMTFWVLAGVLALAQRRALVRVLGGISIALACLSKEAAVVVPVLLVADAWLVERRRPEWSREGLAMAGAVAATATHVAFVPPAGGGFEPGGLAARVPATLGHFVHRTVWWLDPSVEPVPREFDAAGQEVFAGWAVALGAGLVLSLAVLGWLAVRRSSLRPWFSDALWYVLPLLPAANVVALDGPTLVADRYLFLPMLGLGALLARAVLPLAASDSHRRALMVGAALLGIALGVPSALHARHFETERALWEHEYGRNPRSFTAINELAALARSEGDAEHALELYRHGRRVAAERNQPAVAITYALKMGAVLLRVTSDAEQERLRALRDFYDLFHEQPRLRIDVPELRLDERVSERNWRGLRSHPDTCLLPRAMAHVRTGSLSAAEQQLRRLLARDSRRAMAWNLLIAVHGRRGQWEAARAAYERAARRVPGDASVEAMGEALARARAIASAPAPNPIAAAIRDARVQRELGAPEAARRILDAALQRYPNEPRLVLARARADVADARFDLARRVLERARDADPDNRERWEAALRRLAEAEAERRR